MTYEGPLLARGRVVSVLSPYDSDIHMAHPAGSNTASDKLLYITRAQGLYQAAAREAPVSNNFSSHRSQQGRANSIERQIIGRTGGIPLSFELIEV